MAKSIKNGTVVQSLRSALFRGFGTRQRQARQPGLKHSKARFHVRSLPPMFWTIITRLAGFSIQIVIINCLSCECGSGLSKTNHTMRPT